MQFQLIHEKQLPRSSLKNVSADLIQTVLLNRLDQENGVDVREYDKNDTDWMIDSSIAAIKDIPEIKVAGQVFKVIMLPPPTSSSPAVLVVSNKNNLPYDERLIQKLVETFLLENNVTVQFKSIVAGKAVFAVLSGEWNDEEIIAGTQTFLVAKFSSEEEFYGLIQNEPSFPELFVYSENGTFNKYHIKKIIESLDNELDLRVECKRFTDVEGIFSLMSGEFQQDEVIVVKGREYHVSLKGFEKKHPTPAKSVEPSRFMTETKSPIRPMNSNPPKYARMKLPPPPPKVAASSDEENSNNTKAQIILESYERALSLIPICAEKTLLHCCYRVFKLFSEKNTSTRSELVTDLNEKLNTFNLQLKQESLKLDTFQFSIKSIKTLLRSLTAKMDSKNDSEILEIYHGLLQHFKGCLQNIRHIDTDLLVKLLVDTEAASSCVIGKDIILLLGGTGAGKSTTIHFLAGSELDSVTLLPLKGKEAPGTEAFIVSNKVISETRIVNSLDLSFDGRVFSLVDTPGFDDNRGIEIDIANGLGVVSAVRQARSVCPVIFLNGKSAGDRLDSFLQQLTAPTVMFADIYKVLPSISYIFTKFDSEKDRIELLDLLKQKVKEVDAMAKIMLTDLIEKIEQRGKEPLFLHPIHCNREHVKAELLKPPIDSPSVMIKNFATPNSSQKLRNQVESHRYLIERALERDEFKLIFYKTYQLKVLQEHIKIHDVQEAFKYIVTFLAKHADNTFNQVMYQLETCALEENVNLAASLSECADRLRGLIQFEVLCEEYFPPGEQSSYIEPCVRRLRSILETSLEGITQFCQTASQSVELTRDELGAYYLSRETEVMQLSRKLEKLHFLSSVFTANYNYDLNTIYMEGKNYHLALKRLPHSEDINLPLNSQFYNAEETFLKTKQDLMTTTEMIYEDMKRSLSNDNVEAAVFLLTQLSLLSQHLDQFFEGYLTDTYEKAKYELSTVVQTKFCEAERVLSVVKEVDKLSDTERVVVFEAFNATVSVTELSSYLEKLLVLEDINRFNNYHDTLVQLLKQQIVQFAEKVDQHLKDVSNQYLTESPLNQIAREVEQVFALKAVRPLAMVLASELALVLSVIKSYLEEQRSFLSHALNLMKNDSWGFDVKLFISKLNQLQGLQSLQAIPNLEDDIFATGNDYKDVLTQLKDSFSTVWSNVQSADLSYESPDMIKNFIDTIRTLNEFAEVMNHHVEVRPSLTDDAASSMVPAVVLPKLPTAAATATTITEANTTSTATALPLTSRSTKEKDAQKKKKLSSAAMCTFPERISDVPFTKPSVKEAQLSQIEKKTEDKPPVGDTTVDSTRPVDLPPVEPFLPAKRTAENIHTENYVFPTQKSVKLLSEGAGPLDEMFDRAIRDGSLHVEASQATVAAIAKRVIREFEMKCSQQAIRAIQLFPVDGSLVSDYRIDRDKAWKAIQFLHNVAVHFNIKELLTLSSTIDKFIEQHFTLLSQELLDYWLKTVSDTTEMALEARAMIANGLLNTFEYLRSLCEYFNRYSGSAVVGENFKDFQKLLFSDRPMALALQWFQIGSESEAGTCLVYLQSLPTPSEVNRNQTEVESTDVEGEIELNLLIARLGIVRSLVVLDKFWSIFNTDTAAVAAIKTFKQFEVEFSASIQNIKENVAVHINAENYEVLANFFATNGVPTGDGVMDALFTKLKEKLTALGDKTATLVLNDLAKGMVDSIEDEYHRLETAKTALDPYLPIAVKDLFVTQFSAIYRNLLRSLQNYVNLAVEEIPKGNFQVTEDQLLYSRTFIPKFFGKLPEYEALFPAKYPLEVKVDIDAPYLAIHEFMNGLLQKYIDGIAAVLNKQVEQPEETNRSGTVGEFDFLTTTELDDEEVAQRFARGGTSGSGPGDRYFQTAEERPAALSPRLVHQNSRESRREQQSTLVAVTAVAAEPENSITDLFLSTVPPKRLAENLGEAYKVNRNAMFEDFRKELIRVLETEFKKLVTLVEGDRLPMNLRETMLLELQKTLPLFPQELDAELFTVLSRLQEMLEIEKKSYKPKDIQVVGAEDFKLSIAQFASCCRRGFFPQAYQWFLTLHKMISDSLTKYQQEMMIGNLQVIFLELGQLYASWKIYFSNVLETNRDRNPRYFRELCRENPQYIQQLWLLIDKIYRFIDDLSLRIYQDLMLPLEEIGVTDPSFFAVYSKNFAHMTTLYEIQSTKLFEKIEIGIRVLCNQRNYNLANRLVDLYKRLLDAFQSSSKQLTTKVEDTVKAPESLDEAYWKDFKRLADVYETSGELYQKFLVVLTQANKAHPNGGSPLSMLFEDLQSKASISSYDVTMKDISKHMETSHEYCKTIIILNNPKLETLNNVDRDNLYKEYMRHFQIFIPFLSNFERQWKTRGLLEELNQKFEEMKTRLVEQFRTLSKYLITVLNDNIKPFSTYQQHLVEIFTRFQKWYLNFDCCLGFLAKLQPSIGAHLSNASQEIKTLHSEVKDTFERLVESVKSKINFSTMTNQAMIEKLVYLKFLSETLGGFKPFLTSMIDNCLNEYKTATSMQRIIDLSLELNKPSQVYSSYGQLILNDHKAFESVRVAMFNDKIARFKIDDALHDTQGIRGTDLNKSVLRDDYTVFDAAYKSRVQAGLADPSKACKDILEDVKKKCGTKPTLSKQRVMDLLVLLFAYWTLTNTDSFQEIQAGGSKGEGGGSGGGSASANATGSSSTDSQKYLLMPHVGQLLALFRIFGFDDPKEEVKSHLVQIGTGEGKSVILAVASTILALCQHVVHCVCYSEYLSRRDYKAFSQFFYAFGVNDLITYGTFTELSEQYIEDETGKNIRYAVETLMGGNISEERKRSAMNRKFTPAYPKVLLIDEVDVFFTQDFYGSQYSPIAKLLHPTIPDLLNKVWALSRTGAVTFSAITALPEYQKMIQAFPNWKSYLEETAKTINGELKEFPSHKEKTDYRIQRDKIGYKDQDKISFSRHYGFQTVFAYLKAFQEKHITNWANVESQLYLPVHCGSVSYAEIPKLYTYILGVTGTLEYLNGQQKDILEGEYKIAKSTFTPSVYGPNKLDFIEKEDVQILVETSYHADITSEIEKRRKNDRPVLVFFETKAKCLDFYDYIKNKFNKVQPRIMTEEVSPEDKETIIRQAASAGAITLLTKEFGRGTDFVIFDESVASNGGIHVLQTFLSLDPSEEIQIKGRAARQGRKGSYSLLLLDKHLDQFCITQQDIDEMRRSGNYLHKLQTQRNAAFTQKWEGNKFNLGEILKEHVKAMAFFKQLKDAENATNSPNFAAMMKFLTEQNISSFPVEKSTSATVVLMDATGSMSSLLDNAKNAVKTMFNRAYQIIAEQKPGAIFEVQFACYRNYNAPDNELLESSSWSTKPEPLYEFMNRVGPNYGMGNEAIEVGFWHVNNEIKNGKKVSQVILIGDQPPNTRSEVGEKRSQRGESYWTGTTRFNKLTYYEEELTQLVANKVIVHTFPVASSAENAFRGIAQRTKGEYNYLNVSDHAKAAETLINLVTTKILKDIGGATDGERLVMAYKQKFGYVN